LEQKNSKSVASEASEAGKKVFFAPPGKPGINKRENKCFKKSEQKYTRTYKTVFYEKYSC